MNGHEAASPRKLKFDQLRTDYELFLQTFEKPSWLYRYLSRRNELSPLFLQRNLSYMKDRRTSRSYKQQDKRREFFVDNMLNKVKEEKNPVNESQSLESCLGLTFDGFFHGPGFAEQIFDSSDPDVHELLKDEFVKVDLHLIQIYQRKKKDAENDTPMDIIPLGTCKAPWNPRSNLLSPCHTFKMAIPASCFSENGRAIKTHIISLTVSILVPERKKRGKGGKKAKATSEPGKEPPRKRLKSDNRSDAKHDSSTLENDENNEPQNLNKQIASFSAELIVFDRYKNCLLSEGEYELLLQENILNQTSKLTDSSKLQTKLGPFEAFCFGPTIKFRLKWDSKPLVPILPAASSIQPKVEPLTPTQERETDPVVEEKVFYQFIYNSNTRQQTEAREGFHCPWCELNCIKVTNLLRHLKCCHGRFSFMYTALKSGHRIDVCMNENFEGSLKNSSKDIGLVTTMHGKPVKRTPATQDIVRRRQKHSRKEDIQEFADPGYDGDENTSIMKGHDRQYYHSYDNQPLLANDMEVNSDIDCAPDWLKHKTQQMIEEFTDVNPGEKELMKMWNIHMLDKGYISDASISAACISFVNVYGRIIQDKKLAGNLLLHLNNLLDFQIIPLSTVLNTMQHLKTIQVEE